MLVVRGRSLLGAARAAFALETDPADAKRRVLVEMKNELAPDLGMLAFRIGAREFGQGQSAARVEFEPQHHPLNPREFAARQARSLNSATADAIEFLSALGGGGKQLKVSHIEHEARAAEALLRANHTLAQSRVLRDARMAMGLGIIREGADSGAWVWAKAGPPAQPGFCSPEPIPTARARADQAAGLGQQLTAIPETRRSSAANADPGQSD